MPEIIKAVDGSSVHIVRGSSAMVTVYFKDLDGIALTKAEFSSLQATLIRATDGAIINGRLNQDVFDANDGSVADDPVTGYAVLTMFLGPDDTAICCSGSPSRIETIILKLKWTWLAAGAPPVLRTGVDQFEIKVEETRR